jgi:hypothetical protein
MSNSHQNNNSPDTLEEYCRIEQFRSNDSKEGDEKNNSTRQNISLSENEFTIEKLRTSYGSSASTVMNGSNEHNNEKLRTSDGSAASTVITSNKFLDSSLEDSLRTLDVLKEGVGGTTAEATTSTGRSSSTEEIRAATISNTALHSSFNAGQIKPRPLNTHHNNPNANSVHSSTRSDDSSMYGLDASWCSIDKSTPDSRFLSTLMNSLDEVVGGDDTNNMEEFLRANTLGSGGEGTVGTNDTDENDFECNVSGKDRLSSSLKRRLSAGFRSSLKSVGEQTSLSERDPSEREDTDTDDERGGIGGGAPLFRTRRSSGSHQAGRVVHVGGGGDADTDSNLCQLRGKARGPVSRNSSIGSLHSTGSNSSLPMSGLQVLHTSLQAARKSSLQHVENAVQSPSTHQSLRRRASDMSSRHHSKTSSTLDGDVDFSAEDFNRSCFGNDIGGTPPDGDNEDIDDTQFLVAEVGGKDYLRASRSVWTMRIIVVVTFVIVSVVVTCLTYIIFRNMEMTALKHEFNDIAALIIGNSMRILDSSGTSLSGLGEVYTGMFNEGESVAWNHPPSVMLSPSSTCANDESWKSSWSNVTLPGYNEIATSILNITAYRTIAFAPLLLDVDNRVNEWEEYANINALSEVRDVVSNGIRGSTKNITASSVLFPAWQVSPKEVMREGMMWDLYSHPLYNSPLSHILSTLDDGVGVVAATELMTCGDNLLPVGTTKEIPTSQPEDHSGLQHRGLLSEDDNCISVFAPVKKSFPTNTSSNNIVGVVTGVLAWKDILVYHSYGHKDLEWHHGQRGGVHVVIRSTAKQSNGSIVTNHATYLVDDHQALYLGPGEDHIDSKHSAMMQSYIYTFPNDGVSYTVEVHPTDESCATYGISKQPMVLAVIAASFFFLSTLVFFVYDYFVNYRQRVVERNAAHSTRIVNSLFPTFIRGKMLGQDSKSLHREESLRQNNSTAAVASQSSHIQSSQESVQRYDEEAPAPVGGKALSYRAGTINKGNSRRRGLKLNFDTPATQLKRFLTHPMPSREYDYNLSTSIIEMDPIAEVFENTTVMLADIEGFTAWCSGESLNIVICCSRSYCFSSLFLYRRL